MLMQIPFAVSLALATGPYLDFWNWGVQMFTYSEKGVQMLRKYWFGGQKLRV